MKKRILVLDNSMDQAVSRPVEAWARYFGKVPFDAIQLPSSETIPDLDRYTHLLLTGSEASFKEPQPWFDAEANTVRNAVKRGLPVLGSGFGHQLLAWTISGPEYVRRARMPELGWVAIDIVRSDPLIASFPNPWHTYTAHVDEVIDPPEPWRVLAANETCSVQVMRYGDCPVWGIQPRPEILPDEARFQMEADIDQFPRYAQQIRRSIIESPVRDDAVAPQLMSAFLKRKPQKHDT